MKLMDDMEILMRAMLKTPFCNDMYESYGDTAQPSWAHVSTYETERVGITSLPNEDKSINIWNLETEEPIPTLTSKIMI